MQRHDQQLFERYRASRDPACREALVRRYLPLARRLAASYTDRGEPYDDLFQVASLGLLKAIDRYDPGRGAAFSSYAVPTIVGELKRHYRDATGSLRVPRSVYELAIGLGRARERLAAQLGREPTVAELAQAGGVSTEAVLEALGAAAANRTVSLEMPSLQDGARTVADALGAPDDAYRRVEQRALLDDLFRCLSARERRVLGLRYGHELTQREIADQLGLSQVAVSRMLRRVLPRLSEFAQR
jgi:RNA polymerase sigma-B factor